MRIATIGLLLLAGAEPQADLKAAFEAKRATDPVAAFKHLADNPATPAPFARAALAKQISEDLAAGIKALEANQPELLDRHFTRAAVLADLYSKDFSRELLRWIRLAKAPHATPGGCVPCRNSGASPCAACKGAGQALQPCPRCDAKGSVPCILCEGSGTLDHHGYQGPLVLSIDRNTKVSFKDDTGKSRSGTLAAQTLTYQVAPCRGGSFSLGTESVPAKGERKVGTATQTCEKFWGEMKMFAFSGKAKMKVNTPKGPLTPVSPALARRFFGDYETCRGGRVPCDRCSGRKSDPCSLCAAKGQALLPCGTCEGSSATACADCRGTGDTTWMSKVIAQAPALSEALKASTVALREWMGARSGRAARAADLSRRLEDAKKGADAAAKVNADQGVVDVQCPKCKGSGGDCEDCWGAGRREFVIGTPQFERYALIDRLTRQLAEASKPGPAAPPALPPLPESEALAAAPAPAPAPVPLPAPVPGAPLVIPKAIDEMIAKGDALFEEGKQHLEKSKAAGANATAWIEEGLKAVKSLRDAQALYAAAQERLDETAQPVPQALQQKIRTALQALVMARKQIP